MYDQVFVADHFFLSLVILSCVKPKLLLFIPSDALKVCQFNNRCKSIIREFAFKNGRTNWFACCELNHIRFTTFIWATAILWLITIATKQKKIANVNMISDCLAVRVSWRAINSKWTEHSLHKRWCGAINIVVRTITPLLSLLSNYLPPIITSNWQKIRKQFFAPNKSNSSANRLCLSGKSNESVYFTVNFVCMSLVNDKESTFSCDRVLLRFFWMRNESRQIPLIYRFT